MPPNDRDKLNRIDELKGKLFSKSYEMKVEHRDGFKELDKKDVPDAWQKAQPTQLQSYSKYGKNFFMKTPIFKKFFFFSLAFFVLTIAYASYVFFIGGNTISNENIDISVVGNNFTAGGDEFSLVVGVTNRNNSPLQLADLIMEYPKGSSGGGDSAGGVERNRISLGTIPAGAVHNENLKLVLYGEEGSVVPIKISLEYRIEGSNAIFIKDKSYDVTVSSTPLNLSIDAPTTVSPNQDMTLNIKATLNATKPAAKILLKVSYPAGFQFGSAVPQPSLGNNIWSLGDLAPGAERSIAITGKMINASDGEEKTFQIAGGSQSESDKSMIDVTYNALPYKISIKKPFIEAQLFVDGVYQREYAEPSNTSIHGQIHWTNNLDTKVNDLSIRAKISGNAINRKTINAEQGFYDSSSDTITWNNSSQNDFKEVNPGDSGIVSFTISPLSLFSANGGMLPDPSIRIDVSISGKQLVSGYATQDINNSDFSVIKIVSDIGLNAKALYYSGPFTNTGSIPPKAEKETTYTVVWSLSNTANNISKASVRSTIPQWVRFAGSISPKSENLTYNASTKEIVWNVGAIPKGTGITNADHTVSFQVAFTPSLSQVGKIPVLINEATLTGHDDFANVDVSSKKAALHTELDSDPQFPPGAGTVTE